MKQQRIHTGLFLFGLLLLGAIGCIDGTLISNSQKREAINIRFQAQKELAMNRREQLFDVFQTRLTKHEQEGLEFLYAYMPLSDLSIHNGDFFLQQVRSSLMAREVFSWGKSIPDDIFLHYVLPVRVNNEYLDSGRVVFFNELRERLKGLSLKEAALEVNHWCHEQVTYHSSDEYRTSSPLSTVKTAYGRCGEQSTFTVAAMRAACIPARQVYTPRWAHTDDNHAWVEVWINGNWHFLGACEPEPALNRGWFEIPATRAMLIHHKVYGHINTYEEVINRTKGYTEVNILNEYANTRSIVVKVLNEDNTPVKGAKVEFQLVNFSEFYPIATLETNENGYCSLTTGLGAVMVWTAHQNQLAYAKIGEETSDTLVLSLRDNSLSGIIENYSLKAPAVREISEREPHGDLRSHNQRLFKEDSIRTAYERSFIDSLSVTHIVQNMGYAGNELWEIFQESRGNWAEMKEFLEYAGAGKSGRATTLVSIVSPKDRRDTPLSVFKDHYEFSDERYCRNADVFNNYVLNPRINNEMISSYKQVIRNYFGEKMTQNTEKNIEFLARWVRDSIVVVDDANDWKVPVLPVGVLEMRVSDTNSRDIFFVAAMRSFGFPARIEKVNKQVQIFVSDKWTDVNLSAGIIGDYPKGKVIIKDTRRNSALPLTKYFQHFTIGRFNGFGFTSLDYSESDVFSKFPASLTLNKGLHVLVTSARLPNGTVNVRRHFFEVEEGKTIEIPLIIPDLSESDTLPEIEIQLDKVLKEISTGNSINIKSLHGKNGLVMMWINPGLEPTKHLINDLQRLRINFNNWPGNFVMMIEPEKITPGFKTANYTNLPERTLFVMENSGWLKQIKESIKVKTEADLPVVFVLNDSGKVVFHSSGYRIGIGDEILKQLFNPCNANN